MSRCAFYCKNADLKRIHPGVPENPRHYKCQKCATVHSIEDNGEEVVTRRDGTEMGRRKHQGLYDMAGHKRISKHG